MGTTTCPPPPPICSLALSVASMERSGQVTHLTGQCATADLLPGCVCLPRLEVGRGVLRACVFRE